MCTVDGFEVVEGFDSRFLSALPCMRRDESGGTNQARRGEAWVFMRGCTERTRMPLVRVHGGRGLVRT